MSILRSGLRFRQRLVDPLDGFVDFSACLESNDNGVDFLPTWRSGWISRGPRVW